MKITKRQLKRIIREEVETLEYDMLQDTVDELLDADHPEDVVPQRDSWAGGQNVHNQVDHGEASGGGPNTRGQEVMKVTESQLKRIIRKTTRLHEAKAKVPKNIRKIVMDAAKGFSEGFEVVEFRVHPRTGAWLIETAVEDPDYVVPDFVDYLSENETLSEHEINYDDWLIAIEPLHDDDDDGWDDDPEW